MLLLRRDEYTAAHGGVTDGARQPPEARRRGARSACRRARWPATAPREALALHGTHETAILPWPAALRVRARVEVDRQPPRVQRRARARDAPRGVAAGVVGGVDEPGEPPALQAGERPGERRDERAVARHRAEDRDAPRDDVAASPGGVDRDPVLAVREPDGELAEAPLDGDGADDPPAPGGGPWLEHGDARAPVVRHHARHGRRVARRDDHRGLAPLGVRDAGRRRDDLGVARDAVGDDAGDRDGAAAGERQAAAAPQAAQARRRRRQQHAAGGQEEERALTGHARVRARAGDVDVERERIAGRRRVDDAARGGRRAAQQPLRPRALRQRLDGAAAAQAPDPRRGQAVAAADEDEPARGRRRDRRSRRRGRGRARSLPRPVPFAVAVAGRRDARDDRRREHEQREGRQRHATGHVVATVALPGSRRPASTTTAAFTLRTGR